MSDMTRMGTKKEEVVEETINAYRVQKMADGSVRIKSGGHVVQASTYFEALANYAQSEGAHIDQLPEHLRDDHRERIHDGVIELASLNSQGFTPEQILDAVTGQPLPVVLDDLVQNRDHGPLCWCHRCLDHTDNDLLEEDAE